MTTRIVVSAKTEEGLEAPVSAHFGRCPYFTLIEVDSDEVEAVESVANPHYANHQPGQVPAFVKGLGAEVMISGGMGRRAIALFDHYGIQIATGANGTVGEALDCYLRGDLTESGACPESLAHRHNHG
ncbi:MAG: NifB/NifX family molybdenum-iron cluster-binding protein [Anaerolineae bacterium]